MKVKLLIISLFILLSLNVAAQNEFKWGLALINFDDKTTLQFYNSPKDKEPAKVVQFFNDTKINSWNIKSLESHKEWLSPEVLHLDNSVFTFRCLAVKGDWVKLLVHQEKGTTLWLEIRQNVELLSWEIYLENMRSVARSPNAPQKIRTSPSLKAAEIKYEGNDCFEVKSMKGEWVEIATAENCEGNEKKTIIKSGWIQWRKKNKLLIEYFISS